MQNVQEGRIKWLATGKHTLYYITLLNVTYNLEICFLILRTSTSQKIVVCVKFLAIILTLRIDTYFISIAFRKCI